MAVALDEPVGLPRLADTPCLEVVVLHREPLEDGPRAVRGHVIGGVDPVAERGSVADGLLDEDVLVVDQHDAHDLPAHLVLFGSPLE